jgi:hypothetical protein
VTASVRTWRGDLLLVGLAVSAALVATPLIAGDPTFGLQLGAALLLTLLVALRPVAAVTLYVAASPVLVGLGRGAVVPGLRLNEVLLLPLLAGLGVLVLGRLWRLRRLPTGFSGMDLVVLAAAFTSSISPLLWMYARSREIGTDDVLYALAVWKLAAVYAVVRLFLRDVASVRRVLVAVIAVASLIGAVGVLQALGIGPVIDVLAAWVPPEEGGYKLTMNRGTSTLGNPIAFGDLMLYASVAAVALALHGDRRAKLLWAAAAWLSVCALASGQFSIVLGLGTAAIAFALVTGTARRLVGPLLALLAVALVALQPVLSARTSSIDPDTGLPDSWTGRYGRFDNLERYFWPEIAADYNWMFGVRTSSRVPGEESWREWIYIESGWTWALWNGGLPLLVAVLALIVLAVRIGRRLRRSAEPVVAAVGTTLATVPWVLAVLMFLDPHLTLRGGGELLFVLLAVGATFATTQRAAPVPASDGGPTS